MRGRKAYLDGIRCLSAMAVVMIHVCMAARTDFPGYSRFQDWVSLSIPNLLHFAVPCFLMITGALFLNPERSLSIPALFRKHIARYLAVILLFGWGFALCEQVFTAGRLGLAQLSDAFLAMLGGKGWDHMWYLYMLVAVMLLVPLLKAAADAGRRDVLRYIMGVAFLFGSFVHMWEILTGIGIGVDNPFSSVYVGYLILGYLLDTGKRVFWNSDKVCIAGVAVSAAVILGVCYVDIYGAFDGAWGMGGSLVVLGGYQSPFTVLMALFLFQLGKNHEEGLDGMLQAGGRAARLVSVLTRVSFGVYIIHMFWINILYKLFRIGPFGGWMAGRLLGMWAVVMVLSSLTAWGMRYLPIFRRIL